MSARSVRGLRVFEPTGDETETVELPSNDRRYRVVRTIIDRGLLILESDGGRRALRDLARMIVMGRRSDRRVQACVYPSNDTNFTYLNHYVDQFLRLMRSECPEVYLTELPGEAATIRYDWATPESTLDDFHPQDAGHLQLEWMIVDHMANTQNNDRYNMYMFQMAISVGHEMGHFLTGYLTGLGSPRTPRTVQVPGSIAEAGHYWEVRALGGIVEFFSDPRDPDNVDQAGIAYIFPDGRSASQGRRVSTRYIEGFVAGGTGFRLPVEASSSGEPKTRTQLERVSNEMSVLRERAIAAGGYIPRSSSSNQATSSRHRARVQQQYHQQEYYEQSY